MKKKMIQINKMTIKDGLNFDSNFHSFEMKTGEVFRKKSKDQSISLHFN